MCVGASRPVSSAYDCARQERGEVIDETKGAADAACRAGMRGSRGASPGRATPWRRAGWAVRVRAIEALGTLPWGRGSPVGGIAVHCAGLQCLSGGGRHACAAEFAVSETRIGELEV